MPPDDSGIGSREPVGEGSGEAGLSRRSLIQRASVIGISGAMAAGVALPALGDTTLVSAAQGATDAATAVADGVALPPSVPPWMQVWGPLPSEYGSRSPFEDHVVRLPSAT